MLYFDRLHDEHFGTVRQQIYSALHFPLHVVLVLVLQGVSLLIIWVVALRGLDETDTRFRSVQALKQAGSFTNGTQLSDNLRASIDTYLWRWVPKGVDVSKELDVWNKSLDTLTMSYDAVLLDPMNMTAATFMNSSFYTAETVSIQAMFSSLGISIPKDKSVMKTGNITMAFDKKDLMQKYEDRFTLVFDYVFISVRVAFSPQLQTITNRNIGWYRTSRYDHNRLFVASRGTTQQERVHATGSQRCRRFSAWPCLLGRYEPDAVRDVH
jgi:hypothetical protein